MTMISLRRWFLSVHKGALPPVTGIKTTALVCPPLPDFHVFPLADNLRHKLFVQIGHFRIPIPYGRWMKAVLKPSIGRRTQKVGEISSDNASSVPTNASHVVGKPVNGAS